MERMMPVQQLERKSSFDELSEAEAYCVFDQAAQRYLGMSAAEFLGKLGSGYFEHEDDAVQQRASDVALLLPLIDKR